MKASQKTRKEMNKRHLNKRRDKKTNLNSTLATRVDRTNLNSIGEIKRKDFSQITYYKYITKAILAKNIPN